MKVSDEIVDDFLKCKYKAYLRLKNQVSHQTPLEEFFAEKKSSIEQKYFNKSFSISLENIQLRYFPVDSVLSATNVDFNNLQKDKLLFEIKVGDSDELSIIPYHFSASDKIGKQDKIILIFNSIILRNILNINIRQGKIVNANKIEKVNLFPYLSVTEKIILQLEKISETPPFFSRNKHCNWCCFKDFCKKKATQDDHLSLLSSIDEKLTKDFHSKGIFTLKQLSYTFKPRRARIDAKTATSRHIHALKALALRKETICIYKKDFEIDFQFPRIFLDVEGYIDSKQVYLIGIVIDKGESYLIKRSFWVPNVNRRARVIYNEFIDYIMYYCPDGANLFCYGKYDINFLVQLRDGIKKLDRRKYITDLINKSSDLLKIFLLKVYLPTYSNDLKTISRYLGYQWESEIVSGLDAYIIRKKWENTRDKRFKNEIIKYNLQDCLALKVLVKFLKELGDESEKLDKFKISSDFSEEVRRRYSGRNFDAKNQILEGFKFINERAYFNYQRDKIYFRTQGNRAPQKKYKPKSHPKPNKIVLLKETSPCPHCKSKKTEISKFGFHEKRVIDLKIKKHGIERFITLYKSHPVKCLSCNKSFRSPAYQELNKYGHILMSWVIYQHVVNISSFDKITRMVGDFFDLKPRDPIGKDTCYSFKKIMAAYYSEGFEEIKNEIKNWHILHIDETKVKLRDAYGYVWVFTNMESVFFCYRGNRKTNFLKDLIAEFNGVLISDFYKGYDGFECAQQKCLIHLLRDINDMLFKEQQNDELIIISSCFGRLMKKILLTIDKYGLKKRYLKKHLQDVHNFFSFLEGCDYTTKSGLALKKRFLSNKNKLFTFLSYNNVPWNNNNAEHSIRHFALYRKEVKGIINENGLSDYLNLLSLYKTCEYREINFLKFLLSKEQKISHYQQNYTKSGNRRKKQTLQAQNFRP